MLIISYTIDFLNKSVKLLLRLADFFVYTKLIRPILFFIDPEVIHMITLRLLALVSRIAPIRFVMAQLMQVKSSMLEHNVCGMNFDHPIGLAAGLDKYGEAYRAWDMFGFTHAEIGSITFHSQPGNPKPRLWRMPEYQSLQVHFGLNSIGASETYANLKGLLKKRPKSKIGVSIAKTTNISDEEAVNDYVKTFKVQYPVADFITINISCPNVCEMTMTQVDFVKVLIPRLQQENRKLSNRKKIFVKIGPNLSEQDLHTILDICMKHQIDGIVATNLLKDYNGDITLPGVGGLSGNMVKAASTETIKKVYAYTKATIPIIGLGGVFTGKDALEKIKAGASLIQIYTSFIYYGPHTVRKITKELCEELKNQGFTHYRDAIGADVKLD